MSLYAQAVAAERAAKIARDAADHYHDHEAGVLALREENKRLRTALRLVMACAGDIEQATAADLEAALKCGDVETERQANAWLVAREALKTPNVELRGAERDGEAGMRSVPLERRVGGESQSPQHGEKG